MSSGADVNAQLCVYVKDELVVDLWGSAAPSYSPDPNYGPDSLQTVFSSTKSLAAICIACLVDKAQWCQNLVAKLFVMWLYYALRLSLKVNRFVQDCSLLSQSYEERFTFKEGRKSAMYPHYKEFSD